MTFDLKAWGKAYYQANKERIKAREKARATERKATNKAWYARNRERIQARANAWNKAHPEYAKAMYRKHRAAKGLAPRPPAQPRKVLMRRREKQRFDAAKLFVNSLKAKPCVDCGQSFPPECMDFDHVRGQKHENISRLVKRGLAAVKRELAKCDGPVCANCHRIRHIDRRISNDSVGNGEYHEPEVQLTLFKH